MNPYGRAGRPNPPDHGTRARYNSITTPCRCARCRAANAAYQNARRRRFVDPVYGRQLSIDDAA
jgi:hypothetical protein